MRWTFKLAVGAALAAAGSVAAADWNYPQANPGNAAPTTPQVPAAPTVAAPTVAAPAAPAGTACAPCPAKPAKCQTPKCPGQRSLADQLKAFLCYYPTAGDALPKLHVHPWMGPAVGTFYCTSPGGCGVCGPAGVVPSVVPGYAAPPAPPQPPTPMPGPPAPGGRTAGAWEVLPPSRGYAATAEAVPEIPPAARMSPGLPRRGCQGGSEPVAVPSTPVRSAEPAMPTPVVPTSAVEVPPVPEAPALPDINLPAVPVGVVPTTVNPALPATDAAGVEVLEFRAARIITTTDASVQPASGAAAAAPTAPPFARLVALPADGLIRIK